MTALKLMTRTPTTNKATPHRGAQPHLGRARLQRPDREQRPGEVADEVAELGDRVADPEASEVLVGAQ
ncbi:hypothetical protein V5P93_006035 [Actinokineospora auranticolor]|uniref:hypothetical protein n=1 Tax=Actinokineospora auranticolor TaxID=155976 RepID=UPI0011B0885F|nr:hypothetical protein [Actinokineospora auranticolor]